MNDKRAFPRLYRDWGIEFQMSESKSVQTVPIKGGIRDLSAGGFSFRSELASPPDALLHFAIQPTDRFKPIVGVARIAWTRGQEGAYESGAQFVWVGWKDMDALTAIAQYVRDMGSKQPS
jgi:hypothetical protein